MDELENFKRSIDGVFNRANQILDGLMSSHIKWMLAINTGALIWFVGILDKFTVDNHLVFKWWAISTIISLIISEIILYKTSILFFKISIEMKILMLKYQTPESIDKHLDAMKQLKTSMKTCFLADYIFLLGIISMVVYVITYLIMFK